MNTATMEQPVNRYPWRNSDRPAEAARAAQERGDALAAYRSAKAQQASRDDQASALHEKRRLAAAALDEARDELANIDAEIAAAGSDREVTTARGWCRRTAPLELSRAAAAIRRAENKLCGMYATPAVTAKLAECRKAAAELELMETEPDAKAIKAAHAICDGLGINLED